MEPIFSAAKLIHSFILALVLSLILGFVSSQSAQAQQSRFLGFDRGQQGMGLLLGSPSGFRYTYWLNWRHALMGDLVYDFDGILIAQGSYAFYFYDAKDQWRKTRGFNSFLFYLAPGLVTGARVKGTDTASAFILGVRGVGGMEYVFGRGTWAIRAELGGVLNAMGRTFATLQGMAGITYYFGGAHKSGPSSDRASGREGGRDGSSKTKSSTTDDTSEFD